MEETALVETGRTEIDKFVSDKSTFLELVDTVMYLDTIKPYVELSQNGEVGEFLQKRNIPVVHNRTDFDYLYESLRDKLVELRDKGDEKAKLFFEKREYSRQLDSLPQRLSQLEKTASIRFDELKPAFKAVMRYVWNAVIENGFEMDDRNDVDDDLEINSRFGLSIKKSGNLSVSVLGQKHYKNKDRDRKEYAFYFELVKKWEYKKKKIGKRGFLIKRPKYKTIEGINPEPFMFTSLGKNYYAPDKEQFFNNYEHRLNWDKMQKVSVDDLVDYLKKVAITNPNNHLDDIGNFIKVILTLPVKIDDYLKIQEINLGGLLEEIKSLGEDKK
ncbi:MAG: hypothetical protein NTU63_03815 [Candidatus Pacearchaeota archaeon]|nr:hypothetical protein [Candidatus Pacearchaeota archaeon]